MKICYHTRRAGLTRTEVIVIIATVVIVGAFFLLVFPRARVSKKANRSVCRDNLKQVGLSFRIWAGDNNDKFPSHVSTNNGGIMEIAFTTDVFRQFQILSNELGTPKVIVCPSDFRVAAKDFSIMHNTNVSYFLGVDAVETNATMLLAGDRNVENGVKPKNGILLLSASQKIRFTKEIHREVVNILLVDGSVQEVTGEQLRTGILPETGLTTNRIQLP